MGNYEIKLNEEYRDKIKKGKLIFFKEGDSNWNYYIENDIVYAVAKDDNCCSSIFGSINYYHRVKGN